MVESGFMLFTKVVSSLHCFEFDMKCKSDHHCTRIIHVYKSDSIKGVHLTTLLLMRYIVNKNDEYVYPEKSTV
jgi:hypothetical protein